mmetsp:Transcript_33502/g.96174  ORF Transcript_33502/g.96174 Transcript_33502/m.96174 type:complete len:204 (-) Transcript_33502:1316-1927(-)
MNQKNFSNHHVCRTRRMVCFSWNFCRSCCARRSACLIAASAETTVREVLSRVSFRFECRSATLACGVRLRSNGTTSMGRSSSPSGSSSSSRPERRNCIVLRSRSKAWMCWAIGCPRRCCRFTSRQRSPQSICDASMAFTIAKARSTSSTFASMSRAWRSDAVCSASSCSTRRPWSARIRSTLSKTVFACCAFCSTALCSSIIV